MENFPFSGFYGNIGYAAWVLNVFNFEIPRKNLQTKLYYIFLLLGSVMRSHKDTLSVLISVQRKPYR